MEKERAKPQSHQQRENWSTKKKKERERDQIQLRKHRGLLLSFDQTQPQGPQHRKSTLGSQFFFKKKNLKKIIL